MKVSNKRHLQAAFIGLLAGALMGCGATSNTARSPSGLASAGGGGTGGGAAATGSGITGGATGASSVNVNFAASNIATLLAARDMLSSQISGASNAPTRLGITDFGGTLGVRPAVVQGNRLGVGQGRLTIMARNPNAVTPGQGNVILPSGTSTGDGLPLTSPFDLFVDPLLAGRLFITDQVNAGNTGRLIRVTAVTETGADFDQVGLTDLRTPLDVCRFDATAVLVCEYRAEVPGGGQIRRIDVSGTGTDGTTDVFLTGVPFPSSIVSSGGGIFYIACNGNGSAGQFGGVIRVDTGAAGFTVGQAAFNGGVPEPGITLVTPGGGEPAYAFPFDLKIDNNGNVIVAEGGTYNPDTGDLTATPGQGRIRVISAAQAALPNPTSRLVLSGSPADSITFARGPSLTEEDATVDSLFFVEGVGLTTSLRQLTFDTQTGAIFRHLILDTGELNPLDTLFDVGNVGLSVPVNVKYTVNFNGGTNGKVIDVR